MSTPCTPKQREFHAVGRREVVGFRRGSAHRRGRRHPAARGGSPLGADAAHRRLLHRLSRSRNVDTDPGMWTPIDPGRPRKTPEDPDPGMWTPIDPGMWTPINVEIPIETHGDVETPPSSECGHPSTSRYPSRRMETSRRPHHRDVETPIDTMTCPSSRAWIVLGAGHYGHDRGETPINVVRPLKFICQHRLTEDRGDRPCLGASKSPVRSHRMLLPTPMANNQNASRWLNPEANRSTARTAASITSTIAACAKLGSADKTRTQARISTTVANGSNNVCSP